MTRIEDVARASGVSITTVSHVLNGKGRVSERTRVRVRRAADRLGYRPHPAARGLASGRTGLVAIAPSVLTDMPVPYTEIAYFADLINAATGVATNRGYGMVAAPAASGTETWERLPVDGAIVIEPTTGDPKLETLRDRGIPLVTIGRDLGADRPGWRVDTDDIGATREVLDHLARRGARRPALLTWPVHDAFTHETAHAYRQWCREHDAEPICIETAPPDPGGNVRDAESAAAEALLRHQARPDAAYCAYEHLAHALLTATRRWGIHVPRDFRIATVNDLGLAERVDPPLTTIEPNARDLGTVAANLLLDVIEDPSVGPRTLWVETGLTVRRSTA